jgi:hypothetical protein
MYRNIAKKIKVICWVLAIASLAAFLGLAILLLSLGLANGDEALRAAGIQGAITFFVLALVCPLLTFPLYGFAALIEANEKQSESAREISALLKQALADGALAEDMARQLSAVLAKNVAMNTAAPVQRAAQPTPAQTAPTPAEAPAESVLPPRPMGGERAQF